MSVSQRRRDLKLGNLHELSGMDPASIPITEFAYISEGLPVASDVLQREYGLLIDPLQVKPTGTNGAGRVTSLVRSQTVEEFLYATHVGVVVVPDPKLFALNGVDTVLPANATVTPQFDGFVPPTGIVIDAQGARDATARPAQFVWGHDTLQAAWALLNAYDLRMTVGSRFEIFRELCANVGACVSGGMRGFSSTMLSPIPYIRSQNELMGIERGGGRAFLPKTVTAGDGAPTPAEPPLVDVSYGGTQLQGAFGGWYPLNGLLLAPGLPLNILLERTAGDEGSTSYHTRMINSLGDTQTNFQTYSSRFQESVAGSVGFAGAKIWKAGLFRVGILIRGFALAPLACYQAYQDMSRYFDTVNKANLYRDGANTMLAMMPEIMKLAGNNARVGNENLMEYLQKNGNKLGGLSDVDNIDFSRLALPAP